VLFTPGIEMVAKRCPDGARGPLEVAVVQQDGLGVLAPEVEPDGERDRAVFHNNRWELRWFFMYM